nr:MAG TPA: hypothetical protein [Caudoviricetes sp.]
MVNLVFYNIILARINLTISLFFLSTFCPRRLSDK